MTLGLFLETVTSSQIIEVRNYFGESIYKGMAGECKLNRKILVSSFFTVTDETILIHLDFKTRRV